MEKTYLHAVAVSGDNVHQFDAGMVLHKADGWASASAFRTNACVPREMPEGSSLFLPFSLLQFELDNVH